MIREEKEQEPVAWMYDFPDPDNPMEEVVHNWTAYSLAEVELNCGFNIRPLYTAPPPRKPLSDEEMIEIMESCTYDGGKVSWNLFARAIEAAHGIRKEK